MENRFILGQQALTPDGAVYQIIWDEPYDEHITPDAVAQVLPIRAPEDTVAGSTCIFNTEDADGYPVEWLFAFDGTNWALDRVVRGGSAGGGGGGGVSFPTFVMIVNSSTATITWQCDMTYAEVSAVYEREALGQPSDCPCKYQTRNGDIWRKMEYWTKEDIEGEGITFDTALPSTVIGGFMVRTTVSDGGKPNVLYANDGNFYRVVQES